MVYSRGETLKIVREKSERVEKIERLFCQQLITKKIIKGKYLFSDTTSLEKNIGYPTEVSLLKRVIEHAEMVVQSVFKKSAKLRGMSWESNGFAVKEIPI